MFRCQVRMELYVQHVNHSKMAHIDCKVEKQFRENSIFRSKLICCTVTDVI